ncbi:MAG TPA: dUTP diphosphatase [Ruminococcaceae bacterium]|nr:dUTP diphosphatase [Oscillospiraceae bacterium]
MNELKIKKVRNNAIIPQKSTSGSAGYDLFACIESPVTVMPSQIAKIPTGIAIAIDTQDYAAFIFGRSGLGIKYGIAPSNAVGVVDSDYRGEIVVGLANHTDMPYEINPNDRIAQMIIMPVANPQLVLCSELDETQRGSGGFGSTGR